MARIEVRAERLIAAPAERAYCCLAGYRLHHERILPSAFKDYRVEAGGTGAGTVVSFATTTGGRRRDFRVHVTEPEPGRLLQEQDERSDLITTFRVTPDGGRCRVELASTWNARGITGVFERLLAPRLIRRLYVDELARLDAYLQAHAEI